MAVRQTCAPDIVRQQRRPEQGLDVNCVTNNQGRNYVHKVLAIEYKTTVQWLLAKQLRLRPYIGHFYDWNATNSVFC